ncbi:hypothetical protein PVMG_02510 [Plasmodium vivax Mauritania I]|uniref:Rhoptry neck protein 12 n=1 Tax=Plasmodium vivax Mauritania I TaxID=1035515 RepID=A0A0J9TGI3_PLAVI|nr:hypothetical protein PVMG_02510 [Plasmodium vivax Mauritania I]
MGHLKKWRLFCCVYLLVAGIGTLALRKSKVDGGAIGIQGKEKKGPVEKASGEEVKKNGAETNQTSVKVCSGSDSKGGAGEGCPVEASATSGAEQTGEKQDVGKVQNVEVQNDASNKKSILDSVVIPEDSFESAKSLCEFVVIKSEQFKAFCKKSNLFKEIQLLKQKDPNLYAQIAGESYENEATSSFQVLKDEGDRKIVMEDDRHNPKMSIFFLFQKMCVGGIPLACTNILKVDNVFDVNQSGGQLGGGSAGKAEAEDVEGEITGAAEEQASQGASESVADLTEEGS